MAVGDLNGDGKPDLAVANDGSNSVSVLLGNGDGTFQAAAELRRRERSGLRGGGGPQRRRQARPRRRRTIGSNTVSVLLGNGDGTFQAAAELRRRRSSLTPWRWGTSTATASPTSPSRTSAATTSACCWATATAPSRPPRTSPSDSLLRGGGTSTATASPTWPWRTDGSVSVLLGNGDGTFQAAQTSRGVRLRGGGDFNGDGKPDLAVANEQHVSVLLNQFVTTTAVSGPASSTYGQSVTYTATVTSGGTPVTAGTITFLDGNIAISPALAVNANGQATFSIATLNAGSHTITASYSGTPGGAGTTGFGPSAGTTGLVINPALLSATAVNFSATAGAPFTGAVATFTNPDPYGTAASYTAIIDWGDGSTSTGTITGTGTLTVSGSHTYADPAIDAVSVQISHNLGNTTTATVYPTANVTSLGQDVQHGLTGGIGFWHGKNGQALINSFNGGSNATALSTWLATSFANLYGAGAGVNNLTGETNSQVAAFYQSQFALSGSNLEAEVLATALNVYATTQSLGGTIGQAYGFTVSADGLGADSFNVGADGAAFGVANKTTLNVYELLEAVDQQAVFGVLYNGDTTLRKEANDLFDALNKAGSIS